jgi:hypothetical protein
MTPVATLRTVDVELNLVTVPTADPYRRMAILQEERTQALNAMTDALRVRNGAEVLWNGGNSWAAFPVNVRNGLVVEHELYAGILQRLGEYDTLRAQAGLEALNLQLESPPTPVQVTYYVDHGQLVCVYTLHVVRTQLGGAPLGRWTMRHELTPDVTLEAEILVSVRHRMV